MRKTLLTTGIVAMFVVMAFIPVGTSIGQVKPDKVSSLGEPKLEKTWKYKFVDIYQLYDANFTYWWLSPGFISKELGSVGWMVGTFLKVTITGTMKIEGTEDDTTLEFKTTAKSKTGIDAKDLGIIDGDYIEINASVVITPYILPATGRIYNYELLLRARVLNIDLKVYDEPPQ